MWRRGSGIRVQKLRVQGLLFRLQGFGLQVLRFRLQGLASKSLGEMSEADLHSDVEFSI
jgi:hypothetical protein